MPWAGGNYTKGNNGTGGWVGDASLGIGIEAGRHDTQDDDFATGINQCLNKNGSNSCTGDLNLGGFRPVNLAAGTAAAPAICAGGDVNTGIFSPAADQIGIATNGVERVRIDNTGKVGIGTTAPASDLHIQASPSASTTKEYIRITNNTAADTITSRIAFNNYAGIASSIDSIQNAGTNFQSQLVFSTQTGSGMTEKMRIASSGYIGFGTSTNVGNYTFRVNDNDDFVVGRDITGTKQLASKLAYDSTTAFGTNLVIEATGGSYLIRRSSSSIKYKENIIDLDPSYADKLHQFRPVFFRSKCCSDNPHYTHYGFIAEELAQIEPRFVQFGYKPEDYEDYTYTNQDGEEKTGKRLKPDAVGEPEGVQYDRIVTFLTSIVQRQEKRIQALEAKIAELEAA